MDESYFFRKRTDLQLYIFEQNPDTFLSLYRLLKGLQGVSVDRVNCLWRFIWLPHAVLIVPDGSLGHLVQSFRETLSPSSYTI